MLGLGINFTGGLQVDGSGNVVLKPPNANLQMGTGTILCDNISSVDESARIVQDASVITFERKEGMDWIEMGHYE